MSRDITVISLNMFSAFRSLLVILGVMLTLSQAVFTQTVKYFPPFDLEARNEDKVQILGKLGSNFYVYHSSPQQIPQLLILNDSGQIIQTQVLSFIDPFTTSGVNILLQDSTMNFIVQELRGTKHYVKIETLDREGKSLQAPVILDSTDFTQYGSYSFYKMVTSPNKKHFLLYRIVKGFSSIQILFNGIKLNDRGEKISTSFFYVPYNTDMETVGNVFLTNEGTLILPIHDRHDNYKLGTTLKLYCSTLQNLPPQMFDFYLKENKPVELLMDWDTQKNRLAMGALYSNFYSKDIEGAMTMLVNTEKKSIDTIVYLPLDKGFRKQLRHKIYGIPPKEIINSLRVRYFEVDTSGKMHLLADLFTNSAIYGKQFPSIALPSNQAPGSNRPNNYRTVGTVNNLSERDLTNYINLGSSSAAPGSQRFFNADRNNGSGTASTTGSRISGASVATGRQNMDRNFSRNQNNILANSNSNTKTPVLYDASDLVLSSKTLNYKSVYFGVDSSRKFTSRGWSQQFFVPGTDFSNIVIQPGSGGLGIFNYELNSKNNPMLTKHQFAQNTPVLQTTVGKTSDPLLFYRGTYTLIEDKSILSLYVDPKTSLLGLAQIK